MNLFANEQYFRFSRHKYGPYDNSIAIISKNIKEFQKYHNVKNTDEAYAIAYNKLVSGQVEKKLHNLLPFIKKATDFVNEINDDHDLECITTILFLIQEKLDMSEDQIIILFKNWSVDKANRFSNDDIIGGIRKLYDAKLIDKTLMGYCLINF